jgi:CrcB protein
VRAKGATVPPVSSDPDSRAASERRPALVLPHLDRQELAAIFAGGFVGAIVRAALAQGIAVRADGWPWPTFAVNVIGAFALGYFITRLQERLPPSMYARAFLGTGLCGALTTFSTMMLELLRMVEGDHWSLAAGYGGASIVCGLAAVFLSTKLVRRAWVGV